MAPFPGYNYTLPIDASADARLEAVAKILIAFAGHSVYAYESNSIWNIGVDSQASLTIDPAGEKATIEADTTSSSTEVTRETLKETLAAFTTRYTQDGGIVFGQVGFNYSAYINGLEFKQGSWPLVSLLVPRLHIRIQDAVLLRNGTDNDFQVIKTALSQPLPSFHPYNQPDETKNGEKYKAIVQRAVDEINSGLYQKVIASRAVDLPYKVDMVGTLVCGRRANTPRSAFFFDHNGLSATGFSPELVMSFQDGKVATEPLAGTRANVGTEEERSKLRNDLLNDPKEVIEHVISVKEALQELNRFCADGTVAVPDLMAVRPRGKVQHLASTVSGTISPSKDVWDAFNVLFPSITASGIPKMKSLEAIYRLENRPRELYSGAIMCFEGPQSVEASLVLRSVYQDSKRSWLQAGAGIVALSKPERELTETIEKLRSVVGNLVPVGDKSS